MLDKPANLDQRDVTRSGSRLRQCEANVDEG